MPCAIKYGRINHGFVYTVSGRIRYSLASNAQNDICAEEGELVFIPKSCIYTGTYLEDNTEIKIIQFDIASGELPVYLTAAQKITLPNTAQLINDFFNPMENHTYVHPFYFLSCLYALLWQIDKINSKPPTKYKRLKAAIAQINEGWESNTPVSEYAAACNMSEVNFRRLFREYTGMSPIEYRNDIRLKNARALLQSGEFNVAETAYECGFSNISFFIRQYKKKFGYTPKKE